MTVSNNSPQAGFISWTDLNIQYGGVAYAIADGYTDKHYAYWTPAYPNNLVVSDEYPTLTPYDCLVFLNKSGISVVVPTATVLEGDLIVPGSVLAVALAASTITGDKISGGTISAWNIESHTISAELMAANAIGAQAIAAGAVTTDKLVSKAITAEKLDAEDIFANNASIQALIAAGINVDTLFAREATIDELNTALLQTDNYISDKTTADGAAGELEANKSYIRLGKLINSDGVEDNGIALGRALELDVNGNVTRASTANQITGDRQTFYQNGVKVMELRDGAIQGEQGNFQEATIAGAWRQVADSTGTFAMMWVG